MTDRLAELLVGHMRRTGQSAAEMARELGVGVEAVRGWMAASGRDTGEVNEFEHLNTPAKLGTWLRARIADSGQSVRQIAEGTESVSIATIYNWLNGEHLPPPPTAEEPDRFDLLLSNPALSLDLRQRVQLDEVRRRLTGTSLQTASEPAVAWPARSLPVGNRTFTGRGEQLKQLDRLLLRHARGRAVVISALTGMGGAGKTALAVHWARTRQVRATFTDGCLYINLNGYAESPPATVDTALRKLLQQLGVDPNRMPADTEALGAFYQETLAGKRLLVVLDNAHAEPQVRPLLPSDPECIAVITSRKHLQGLDVTDGPVAHMRLDVLTARESASLLRKLLGALVTGTTSDEDIDALGEACGHLPLALQIAAANYLAHARPEGATIRKYADSLGGRRLDALAVDPTDRAMAVTAAMDFSYRHLASDTRRAYRLLGLHPGPTWSYAAAASLIGETIDRTRSILADLVQANLLIEHRPGRYAYHDLVRDHAAALADQVDAEADRREAVRRMLDHYVHTAYTANLLVYPGAPGIAIPLSDRSTGVAVESIADREAAITWFEAEHTAMMAAALKAAGDFDVRVWQLAWTVHHFCSLRGRVHELIEDQDIALAAAQRLNDAAAQAHSHRVLAWANTRLGRLAESHSHLARALELSVLADDLVGQAAVHRNLSHLAQRKGDSTEALAHARRALVLYRGAGDRFGEARALNSIGWYHAQLGEHEEGRRLCEQALTLCLELDYTSLAANVWDSLGYIHQGLGNHSQALVHYQRARTQYQQLGDRYFEADTLTHLGDLYRSSGDAEAARETWQEALDILVDLEFAEADDVQAKLNELESDSGEDAHP